MCFHLIVCRLGLGAVLYNIWKLRNAVLHQGCIPSEERLLLTIKREELGLGTRGHILSPMMTMSCVLIRDVRLVVIPS